MSEPRTRSGRGGKGLAWLASLRLTRTLLITLALLAVAGTILPQLEDVITRHIRPDLLVLLRRLGVFDIYHAPVFLALSGLLCFNLIVCMILRFTAQARQTGPVPPLPRPVGYEVPALNGQGCMDGIVSELGRQYQVHVQSGPSGEVVFAERRRSSRAFGYVLHAGILLIIAGMGIGAFGFQGAVQVPEGRTFDAVETSRGKHPLGYAVRCDAFTVDYYRNGMPKEYLADLTFLSDGRPVIKRRVMVNHPVSFRSKRFYLSDFGMVEQAVLKISGPGFTRTDHAFAGDTLQIKNNAFSVLAVEENLMNMGPAVEIAVQDRNEPNLRFWVFEHIDRIHAVIPDLFDRAPRFDPGRFRPYVFSLQSIQQKHYAGLLARYDPGVPVAAAGAVMVLLGLFVVVLLPHEQLWIRSWQDVLQVVYMSGGRRSSLRPHLKHLLTAREGQAT